MIVLWLLGGVFLLVIKYDLQYNQKTLQFDRAEELFMCSKALADIVIPQVKDSFLFHGKDIL